MPLAADKDFAGKFRNATMVVVEEREQSLNRDLTGLFTEPRAEQQETFPGPARFRQPQFTAT